jgi:multicomponent Na+:H+ antiporter subunit G
VIEVVTTVLLLGGALFMVVGALGVLRLPDLFTRMQAAAKVGTLGVTLIMIAVAVHFSRMGVTTTSVLVIAFFFLTNPVAAHVIGRAAYFRGVPLWERSVMDELREQFPALEEDVAGTSGEEGDERDERDMAG